MVRLDNGLIDLSLSVSQVEIALRDYAYSPRIGLEKLRFSLLSMQKITHLNISNNAYYHRFSSFLDAVNGLLVSGSPYSEYCHNAFSSAADALFQVAIGSQFGSDRSLQLDHLLSLERSCWVTILSLSSEKTRSPMYVDYEARLVEVPASTDSISVDVYLEALSSSGRVSFHLDAIKGASLEGHFLLASVQSLSWLQARFPLLQWQQAFDNNEEDSLKELCKFNYLPLFQNMSIKRDYRYRLLGLSEGRLKAVFYQLFGSLFPADLFNVEQRDRFVPASQNVISFELDADVAYFPVRHGGSVYVGSESIRDNGQKLSYQGCLGCDFLSYFLYEIDTSFGRFVFDKAECLGVYTVSEKDLFVLGSDIWFGVEGGVKAQVVLDMPFLLSNDTAYCLLPKFVAQVLVVKQGQLYFAVPYSNLHEIEGICSRMQAPHSWVKNIWLNPQNLPLLEPCLLNVGKPSVVYGCLEENKPTHPSKNGYYFGRVCGRMFYVKAELVSALLPYQSPFSFTFFDGAEQSSASFIINDGHCFDKVVSKTFLDALLSVSREVPAFSVILECLGTSVVLPFTTCDWRTSLPSGEYVREFSLPSKLIGDDDEVSHFSSLQDDIIVIDKKNYLSFVAGIWPSSSLA
jgi:hypothetical protein